MEKRRFTPPDVADAMEHTVGPYTLSMVYRKIAGDEGETIHVFGPVDGQDREILRFDCFRNQPHVHVGISYLDEPVQPIDASDPFEWSLQQLGRHFPDYLTRSCARCDLPEDWQAAAARAVEVFRSARSEIARVNANARQQGPN